MPNALIATHKYCLQDLFPLRIYTLSKLEINVVDDPSILKPESVDTNTAQLMKQVEACPTK